MCHPENPSKKVSHSNLKMIVVVVPGLQAAMRVFFLQIVLVLLIISSMLVAAEVARDVNANSSTPYRSDFVILNASFPLPFQFLDLITAGRKLLFDPKTNRQASCARSLCGIRHIHVLPNLIMSLLTTAAAGSTLTASKASTSKDFRCMCYTTYKLVECRTP